MRLASLIVLCRAAYACSCGAEPPAPPAARELRPYASTPADLRPYGNFADAYFAHYEKLVEYNGAAREARTVRAGEVDEVRIGFLGPLEGNPDERLGRMMLNGALLAIEEANARGGYCGKPFKLMVHNDQAIWGAASNEIVKMTYDEKVWAMLGSISGDSTHIALRASLKTELPIVNSAATDPTIPETTIPWYFTTIQDDRVQCYTLARRIYSDLKLRRTALLRINDRYGRFGTAKFKAAARRLGYPVVIEQKFFAGETDFRRQLRTIADSDADSIVIWGDQAPTAAIVRQMRELGMKQRVFGSFRTVGGEFLEAAGEAAEGLEAVAPFDPSRDDVSWLAFIAGYQRRFGRHPEMFAPLAYDTMNILLGAICRAGLNRGLIRDALAGIEAYKGVTGQMVFDPNSKNIVPMYLAAVNGGRLSYRRYSMEEPHARIGEGSVPYAGPDTAAASAGQVRIVIFGRGAASTAASPQVAHALRDAKNTYAVTAIESQAPWGKSSSELVKAMWDRQVIGVIAEGREESHLAEQLAVKAFVPVIAISSDRSLTSINIPWIFRLERETPVEHAIRVLLRAADASGASRSPIRQALSSSGEFDGRGEPRAGQSDGAKQ